ncbi:DUF7373 family lipoprotein [Nocardia takedensis]|uniref:DUF7373 family lipoprotein n=1 Tax=Nocardia takedensis TaxID=259390 RepID=UPI0002F75B97|nr:hypothetical protein [Nocardia takedensis]
MRHPRFRGKRTALLLVLLTLGVAGCGTVIPGAATRARPDLSKLDLGNYQTVPRDLGNAQSQRQARARESQRLADYVALPSEVDPAYTDDVWITRSHIVLNSKTLGNIVINDTFDDVAKDLVAGWVNAESTGGDDPATPRRTLNIAVLMFPDAATAASVGPTLEHDDFTYNPDNQPVTIPDQPGTVAHWRPSINSIGSWTVHDRYVVYIKLVDDTGPPDLPALVGRVDQMLDVQRPLLDQFAPTPAAELSRVALDPDGLLGRTLPSAPEAPYRPEPDGVYTGRGIVTLLLNGGKKTFDTLREFEVDRASFGNAVVFRSRTERGAQGLWERWKLSAGLEDGQQVVAAPSGLEDSVECISQHYTTSTGDRLLIGHLCMMRVDRYVVQSRSKQLPELHQQISAQYALLTSP